MWSDYKQIELMLDACRDRGVEVYAVKVFAEFRAIGLSVFESVELVLEDLYGTE